MVEGEIKQESFDIELKAGIGINNNEVEARNTSLAVILSFIIFLSPPKMEKENGREKIPGEKKMKSFHIYVVFLP